MSGLAEVLAGRRGPGVYRWQSAWSPARVREPVEHAGWRFAHVEGARIETPRELHEALQEALVLPDHYGRNLDALADVVRRMDGRQLLLWDTWSVLADAEPRVFAVACTLLGERIVVVLRGSGPEVPGLDVGVLD